MIKQITRTQYEDDELAQLVCAAQQDDRQAFGELVTRYQRAVYAVAYRRLSNHAEAQELCQEVFMQALRKIDQLRDPRCFGSWVCSIASRMAINRALRRAPTVSAETDVFDSACAVNETPLGTMLARERQSQVRSGLKRLRAMDRETLEAFYFRGSSLVEMSEQFDSPVGTIKRRLHVARKRLAQELAALAPA